jgi:hypothetical protein
MSTVDESRLESSQLLGVLRDGIENLDLNAEVIFRAYTRTVLPVDQFVYWQPSVEFKVKGSLHFSQEMQQNQDETFGQATVIFTSEKKITQFENEANTLFVARVGGFRYAFSQQRGFYRPAGLWHYFGHSITPALESQLLDQPGVIDPTQAVTSNSMAVWLGLNTYQNIYTDQAPATSGITLYPAFMVPPNLVPPYGAVYIPDDYPIAIESLPLIDSNRNHTQMVWDKVIITLYGLQNNAKMDFQDFVIQYLRNNQDSVGLRNTPVVRDGNRTQVELQTKAMQSIFEVEVNYYQSRVANIARTLIKEATINYYFESVLAT